MTTQELQQILRSLDKLNENLLRIAGHWKLSLPANPHPIPGK